ncbi:MAG: hypothetical protein ACQESK_09215 [Bacteroidota bacterium]
MKFTKFPLILLLFFSNLSLVLAQNSSEIKTPVIKAHIEVGQVYEFGEYQFEFVRVLSDSRCPENVTCVRAGEIEIEVVVTDAFSENKRKEIEIPAQGGKIELMLDEEKTLYIENVTPYPQNSHTEIKKYQLVVFEEIR